MIQPIVSTLDPVILVGAGALGNTDLEDVRAHSHRIVAVDGGADSLHNAGLVPEVLIGDLDSVSQAAKANLPSERVHHIAEQNSTDFEKALRRVDAPLILGVGFMGARVDHQLAALHVLLRFAHRPILLMSDYEVILHCPPELGVTVAPGATVSLFPLIPVTGTSRGLFWPIDGLDMVPGGQIGTSNRADSEHVHLTMQGRGMIGFFPRSHLGAVVSGLQDAAATTGLWPAL